MEKQAFVRQVAARLGCSERLAEDVTFAVLRELRDRLTPKEAADVAAQFPVSLQCVWFDGDVPDRRVARTHRAEFLANVRRRAVLADAPEAGRAVRAVFATLQDILGTPLRGEAWDVFSQLPKDLKELWLTAHEPTAEAAHR